MHGGSSSIHVDAPLTRRIPRPHFWRVIVMQHLPNDQTFERVTPASKQDHRLSFPPRAFKRNPTAANAFPTPVATADTLQPPGIPPPTRPDVPAHRRPRSPSCPPIPTPPKLNAHPHPPPPPPPHPRLSQPDIPPTRSISPNPGQGIAREVVVGSDTYLLVKDLVNLRGKDLDRRINLRNGVTNIGYQRDYADEAQENFMQACFSMMQVIPSTARNTAAGQKLEEAWKQVQDTSGIVRSQEIDLARTMNAWFDLDNTLAMREDTVYRKLDTLFRVGVPEHDDDDDEGYIETEHLGYIPAPSTSSSSTVRSIEHQYYNEVGEINLLKEKMFNFESEHRRQTFIREARRKTHQNVGPSDEGFDQQYLNDIEAMTRQFFLLKEKMEKLKEFCERQGIEVEDPNLPAFLDHSRRVGRSIHEQSGPHPGAKLKAVVSSRDTEADIARRTKIWAYNAALNKLVDLPEHETWDTLSEDNGPHTMAWADQQAEGDLAFLQDNDLVSAELVADDSALNEEKTVPQTRISSVSQGDPPLRRYSTPALPTFDALAPLRRGVLQSTPQKMIASSLK
jgi:hypothetical protein